MQWIKHSKTSGDKKGGQTKSGGDISPESPVQVMPMLLIILLFSPEAGVEKPE